MFIWIHYWNTKKRLQESEKTVELMGGEDECQPQLLAQRDMIKMELIYYEDELYRFIGNIAVMTSVFITLGIFYGLYFWFILK